MERWERDVDDGWYVTVTRTHPELGVVQGGTGYQVRLNDDDIQAAAAGVAYGLVEDAWGLVVDE